MDIDTYESKTAAWLKTQEHFGVSHPIAFSVMQAARQLDIKYTIALYKEYNSLIKYIEAAQPQKASKTKVDPLLTPVVGLETRGTTTN